MNTYPFSCVIIEDEPLAQRVLENYIARGPELKLVATCETLDEAYKVLIENRVDIIFLDLNLSIESGLSIVQKPGSPGQRYYIVITSAVQQRSVAENIFSNTNYNLVDYLVKPFSYERFMQAIRRVTEVI